MHMDHKQEPFGQDQVLPALELKTLPDGRYNGVAPTTDSPIEIGEIEIFIDGGYIHSKLATSLGIVEETASKDVLNNMLIVQIGEALFVHLEGKKPKSARYDNSPIILFSEKTKGFEKALSVILQRHGPNSLPRLNL